MKENVYQKTNTMALISLLSGILGWAIWLFSFCAGAVVGLATFGLGLICLLPLSVLQWVGWICAVITGHKGLKEIEQTGESGRGFAITGLILGYIGVGFLVVFLCAIVLSLGFGVSIPFFDVLLNQLS